MRSALAPRRVLLGSVGAIALLALSLTLSWGWVAYAQYRTALLVETATATADDIAVANGIHAVERGMTAAALGGDPAAAGLVLAEIRAARARADTLWQDASARAAELRPNNSHRARLHAAAADALRAYAALTEVRARVDRQLQQNGPAVAGAEWVATSTAFIASASRLRDTVIASIDLPRTLAELYFTLKRDVWLASEHAGRERGTLAYYISAGRPVPPKRLRELTAFRAVVEQSLADAEGLQTAPEIARAVAVMHERFLNRYDAVREAVYADAGTGNYRIGAEQWLQESTAAIDAILAVNTAITAQAHEHTERIKGRSRWTLSATVAAIVLIAALLLVNLSRLRQIVDNLFYQKELAEVTLHSIGDAVITTDGGARCQYLNPVAEQLTGWTSEEARGRPLAEVFRIVNAYSRNSEPNPIEICLREQRVVGLNNGTLLIARGGQETEIEDSAAPIQDRDGKIVGAVMVFFDISVAHKIPQLLSYHASHDALTRLINRREFERRLTELMIRAKNSGEQHALCYLDIDQFKVVNDTCGHAAGDKLLGQVAYLLQNQVRETDTLARLGGDEFGLLLEGCHLERAVAIAEKIRQVVKDFRFLWEKKPFELGVSIGLVPITGESASPSQVMSEADAACFAAKEHGRNSVQIYERNNIELAQRHGEMQWVSRITQALSEERFRLYGQLIKPLNGAGRAHCEFLVRMVDAEGKLIPPLTFIPAAERFGLMTDIDRWVVRNAMAAIKGHYARGAARFVCNLNVSGTSLANRHFHRYVIDQIRTHDIPAGAVCFEITETAAVTNFGEATDFITTLREAGCLFALDDFGSGLSSFSYLKNLPVDFLKIDGHLIQGIASDPVSYGMAEAIHRVGRIMGLKTIAEFVSDEAILGKVAELGIDYAQGFFVGMPAPLEETLPN